MQFLDVYKRAFGNAKLAVTELYRQHDADLRDPRKFHGGAPESILNHDLSRQNPLLREQWLDIYERAGFNVLESLNQVPPGAPVVETLVVQAR